ncbi:MAG: hypothetical protein WCB68_07030 [Pyrinomonadaceae bacterium]
MKVLNIFHTVFIKKPFSVINGDRVPELAPSRRCQHITLEAGRRYFIEEVAAPLPGHENWFVILDTGYGAVKSHWLDQHGKGTLELEQWSMERR